MAGHIESLENSDLNAQLKEKVFAITGLKNELRKLKGKNVVNTAISKSIATLAPGMFKVDIEPISARLKNNRDAHELYIEKTIEYADTLRGFVDSARTQYPSKPLLESACMFTKHVQELLVYASQTCPNSPKPSEKLVAVTPSKKDKRLRFIELYCDFILMEFYIDFQCGMTADDVPLDVCMEQHSKGPAKARITGANFYIVGRDLAGNRSKQLQLHEYKGKVLMEPKNALGKQYKKLFQMNDNPHAKTGNERVDAVVIDEESVVIDEESGGKILQGMDLDAKKKETLQVKAKAWWSAEIIAVVTDANRGIGFETIHQLVTHWITVILTSRDIVVSEESTKVLQRGLNVVFHHLDIVEDESIKSFYEWVKKQINNAGGAKQYSVTELVLATNNFGRSNSLGEGSIGTVYKVFAAKWISTLALSLHEEQQFLKEYVRNLPLDHALHSEANTPLSWSICLRISIGIA
ncbi:retrovirus-related pol polyprotein from transposon TNT 1-94 [Tanacetum coccineum]